MKDSLARTLLIALIILLIVEGLLRKLLPGSPAQLALFFKDLLILPLIPYVLKNPLSGLPAKILKAYWILLILLIPLVVFTASRDPLLAVFGLKQYMLYPWVGFAWTRAFLEEKGAYWKTPYRILGFSIFITLPVALLQINLPSTHWLNLGVGGGDLSGFSAGGIQRVSSTFSFIAQYNFYLLFLPASLAICHLWRREGPVSSLAFSLIVISSCYIVSVFITGSRASVLGSLLILTLALFMFLQKARASLFPKVLGLAIALYLAFNLSSFLFPQAFVVYNERSQRMGQQTHTQEVVQRLISSYTLWWGKLLPQAGWTGLGLGTMSNGVQVFSDYAASLRTQVGWGETDMGNTILEGGLYLVILWKGFRLYIIYCCWKAYNRIHSQLSILPAAFFLSHIVLEGINGTLAIQPPLAIWFWISVGSLLLIYGLELQKLKESRKRASASPNDFQTQLVDDSGL